MPLSSGISKTILGSSSKKRGKRLAKKYFQFTSPGTLDLGSIQQIQQVDYFSITPGNGGGSGSPGIPRSTDGGTGGSGGTSGYASVLLSQFGGAPAPISIGINYPTPVSGPSGTNLTIPQAVRDVFSDYTITAYPQGSNGSPGGDSWSGKGGYGGAGGVYFSPNGTLSADRLPSVPNTSGSSGGTG